VARAALDAGLGRESSGDAVARSLVGHETASCWVDSSTGPRRYKFN
jgi:hypothetical protein